MKQSMVLCALLKFTDKFGVVKKAASDAG